jgi:hypothetical protein
MLVKIRIVLALAGAVLLALSIAGPAYSAAPRGHVYDWKGQYLGYVEKMGPGRWWASDPYNSVIDLPTPTRMRITEGFHFFGFAKRRNLGRWDVYTDASGGPKFDGSIRRVSLRRWNVYNKKGQRIGRTVGSGLNAVAAGFSYAFWGRYCCGL